MYTREYSSDAPRIAVPENYSGNALAESGAKAEIQEGEEALSKKAAWESEDAPKDTEVMGRAKDGGFFGGILKNLPFSNIFDGFDIFKGSKIKLGGEEIIIIGVALFLIFTSGADTELGIMLMLLLFIK